MRFLLLFLLVVFVGCGVDSEGADDAAASSEEGLPPADEPPVVNVATAEALVDDVESMNAETIVLNFWATWCAPCRVEFPEFVRYDGEMDGQDVEVRFVSLDNPTDLSLVRRFLIDHGVTEPSYLYTGQGDLTSQLNPFVGGTVPITMILNGDGIVQHTHVGVMTYDDLSQSVATVQAGGDPSANS